VPRDLTMEATSAGVVYGQDVHFLGFPYGLLGKYTLTHQGYPHPFVKKATVSLFQSDEIFLLDGHNNPGFSGGPVVFSDHAWTTNNKVFAVISEYMSVDQPVLAKDDTGHAEPSQSLVVDSNTGIIVAWAVDFAVQLARANPIGVQCTW
jgi:hypothetical protein